MHVACANVDAGAGRFEESDVRRRLETIARDAAFASEAAHLSRRLDVWSARHGVASSAGVPTGFIHGDLFRDNVLWDDTGALVALLDFESASRGVLAYDLMVTVLAWCVGDALDASLVRALLGGYEAERPLEPRERAALVVEGCLAAIRFTVTRITDYAQRGAAEGRVMKDWRRFRMRLDALEALDEAGLGAMLGDRR
jgi:homoserine kinase type II